MKRILSLVLVIILIFGGVIGVQAAEEEGGGGFSTKPEILNPEVTPYDDGGAKGMTNANDAYEQNLNSYDKPEASLGKSTDSSLNANFVALTCMIVGCTSNDGQQKITTPKASAMGQTFGVITELYKPQVTTYTYIADVAKHMGISTPTYAQGYGYYSLQTLLDLWKVFRNVAYVFFTIIIIFIGFVIMFRQKIGGQAVITVQQALPRVIIALLMVTFSYAIAGLAVDLMYLIMFLFLQFLNVTGDEQEKLVSGNFGWVFGRILGGATAQSWSVTNDAVKAIFGDFDQWFNPITLIVKGIGGVLFMLVVVIAAFFSAFRLLFVLLTSYISFLLNVMFAPLILMVGAIPGVKVFQKWLMSLVADLAPFVVVMVLLAFQQVLATALTGRGMTAQYNTGTANAATMFVPPYILSGGVDGEGIASIVSLGILLTLPEFVKKVKQALGGGSGFFGDISGALGAGLLAATRSKPMQVAKKGAALGGGLVARTGLGVMQQRGVAKQLDKNISKARQGVADAKSTYGLGSTQYAEAQKKYKSAKKARETYQAEQYERFGSDATRARFAAQRQKSAAEMASFDRRVAAENAKRHIQGNAVTDANIAALELKRTAAQDRDRKARNSIVVAAGATDENMVRKGIRQLAAATYGEKGIWGGLKQNWTTGKTAGIGGGVADAIAQRLPTKRNVTAIKDYTNLQEKVRRRIANIGSDPMRQAEASALSQWLNSENELANENNYDTAKLAADWARRRDGGEISAQPFVRLD